MDDNPGRNRNDSARATSPDGGNDETTESIANPQTSSASRPVPGGQSDGTPILQDDGTTMLATAQPATTQPATPSTPLRTTPPKLMAEYIEAMIAKRDKEREERYRLETTEGTEEHKRKQVEDDKAWEKKLADDPGFQGMQDVSGQKPFRLEGVGSRPALEVTAEEITAMASKTEDTAGSKPARKMTAEVVQAMRDKMDKEYREKAVKKAAKEAEERKRQQYEEAAARDLACRNDPLFSEFLEYAKQSRNKERKEEQDETAARKSRFANEPWFQQTTANSKSGGNSVSMPKPPGGSSNGAIRPTGGKENSTPKNDATTAGKTTMPPFHTHIEAPSTEEEAAQQLAQAIVMSQGNTADEQEAIVQHLMEMTRPKEGDASHADPSIEHEGLPDRDAEHDPVTDEEMPNAPPALTMEFPIPTPPPGIRTGPPPPPESSDPLWRYSVPHREGVVWTSCNGRGAARRRAIQKVTDERIDVETARRDAVKAEERRKGKEVLKGGRVLDDYEDDEDDEDDNDDDDGKGYGKTVAKNFEEKGPKDGKERKGG